MDVQLLRRRWTNSEVYWSFSAAMFLMVLLPMSSWGKALGATVVLCGLAWAQRRIVREHHELQAQLQAMDRLASVGTLAAGITHELNNPLAYLSSNVDYAVEEFEDCLPRLARALEVCESHPDGLYDDFEEIHCALIAAQQGAQRMREIVADMGLFARHKGKEVGPVRVDQALVLALRMTRNEIVHRARLRVEDGQPVCILGDEHRLTQVFVNLIINAAQAITPGAVDANEIRVRYVTDGVTVSVFIEDTGQGIEDKHLEHIFDPFFTTKPAGQGTGLGLALSRSFIEDMGGAISVDSTPGQGCVFRIVLPTIPCEKENSD
jgi:two-component system, cell cycle sensor histidine kinase and response regulator CckA